MPKIDELLLLMINKSASDLHLKANSKPVFRIYGELIPDEAYKKLTNDEIIQMMGEITTNEQKVKFDETRELDLAYTLPDRKDRFRINVFLQRGAVGVAIRHIPMKIPTIDELGLPQVLKMVSLRSRGLILITGPTGSGKSTTLAAIINHINLNRKCHIITIEDPIEYQYEDIKSMINQRQLGSDTLSFANALRHALREDPDVILVGEMRDLETISLALTAAETGHLVLSTLHTSGAVSTIDRIIDVFPAEQQRQIRTQLAGIIECVVSQILLPKADGKGRVAAFEVLIATPAVRSLIRENKTHQIISVMQTSTSLGMQTLDTSLLMLYKSGVITLRDAMMYSTDPENFKKLV